MGYQMTHFDPPTTYEPRERAAATAAAVIVGSVLLWVIYLFVFAIQLPISAFALGIAVSGTTSSVIITCWYLMRRANAAEHRQIMTVIAELHTDHTQMIAEVQRLKSTMDSQTRESLLEIANDMDTMDDTVVPINRHRPTRPIRPDQFDN
jgi:hypothetical protein